MKRVLLASSLSLLLAGLIAPAAHADKIQTRYLEGLVTGGGRVQIAVDFIVRPGGASKKKFIVSNGKKQFVPKYLTFAATYSVPVSCQEGDALLGHMNNFMSYPHGAAARQGNFSYALGTDDRRGKFGGGIWHKGQRSRASGIIKWIYQNAPQPSGPDYTLCTTNGPRQWTAHQCLRKGKARRGLPRCRKAGWF